MNIDSNLIWPSMGEKETKKPDSEISPLDYLADAARKNLEAFEKIMEKTPDQQVFCNSLETRC